METCACQALLHCRIGFRLVFALAIVLMPCGSSKGWAQSAQQLHAHVRPEITSGKAAKVGAMPPEQRLNFSIVLPLRDEAGLTALLKRIYDPASPDYRHFLSV